MSDLAITATKVGVVESIEQASGPASEDVSAGDYVVLDGASGKVKKGDASTGLQAENGGVCIKTAKAGQATTFVRRGIVDVGDALDALAFNAKLYVSVTAGKIDTAVSAEAGAQTVVIGSVVPAFGHTTADKVLRVNL